MGRGRGELRLGRRGLAMRFAELTLQQAVDMASVQPAALIGCRCGGLDPGNVADLVLFTAAVDDHDGVQVESTWLRGECVFNRASGLKR